MRLLPRQTALGTSGDLELSRVEWRNFWYADETPSSHESRFRNRVELKLGLNHAEMSRDKTLYLLADFEIFVPLSDDVPERFATKRRTRWPRVPSRLEVALRDSLHSRRNERD